MFFCDESKSLVECAINENFLQGIVEVLKPVCCPNCDERFPDEISCDGHVRSAHVQQTDTQSMSTLDPRGLTVKQL